MSLTMCTFIRCLTRCLTNLPTNHGSTLLNLNMVLLLHYSRNIIHPFYSSRLDLFSYKISNLYFNHNDFNTTVAV